MKITVENALTEYPKVRKGMPEIIEKTFDKLPSMMKFYGQSEQITKTIDLWVEKVNLELEKRGEGKKEDPKKSEKIPVPKYNVGDWVIAKVHTSDGGVKESFPVLITEYTETPDGRITYTFDGGEIDVFEDEIIRKTTAPKAKKETKKNATEKTKSTPKANVKKQKQKAEKQTTTDNATPVEALSPEVKLIKRVITLQGKTMKKANSEKTNNPRAILNAIQRAIRTKQIRKTSKYADEIMYAQDALIRMVNGSLNGTMSGADVINFTRYDDLDKVAHSEVVSEAAKIAAQFIKIQEQAGKEKEAGRS